MEGVGAATIRLWPGDPTLIYPAGLKWVEILVQTLLACLIVLVPVPTRIRTIPPPHYFHQG